jgi:hypothetical protein
MNRPRYCVQCGRRFWSRQVNALVCSPACEQARWRAISMLAGTHRYVNGRFVRVA